MQLRIHKNVYIRPGPVTIVDGCIVDYVKECDEILEYFSISDGKWIPVPIKEDVFDLRPQKQSSK